MTDVPSPPCLIALSGLPGTGKTTLARRLASSLGAFHVRIDSIEAALKRCSLRIHPAEDAGYVCGYAVAADNLSGSNIVVADSVNPLPVTRDAWAEVARSKRARLVEVELICSDRHEHRRRVESRSGDLEGSALPTWQQVQEREIAPWNRARLVIDTARTTPESAATDIASRLA